MSRRYNRTPVTQARKPTFNVVKPFQGVTTIQLNCEMATEIANFLSGFDVEDLEEDLTKLQNTLSVFGNEAEESEEPQYEGDHITCEKREYSISTSVGGVTALSVNEDARQLLIDVIDECEGKVDRIVWAFRLALEDPTGGPRDNRDRSYRSRDNQRYRR